MKIKGVNICKAFRNIVGVFAGEMTEVFTKSHGSKEEEMTKCPWGRGKF